jgi:hypothetical protein
MPLWPFLRAPRASFAGGDDALVATAGLRVAATPSSWKTATIAASSSDCPDSSAAAEDDSSELAAFC